MLDRPGSRVFGSAREPDRDLVGLAADARLAVRRAEGACAARDGRGLLGLGGHERTLEDDRPLRERYRRRALVRARQRAAAGLDERALLAQDAGRAAVRAGHAVADDDVVAGGEARLVEVDERQLGDLAGL